jgi:hypothetical protein
LASSSGSSLADDDRWYQKHQKLAHMNTTEIAIVNVEHDRTFVVGFWVGDQVVGAFVGWAVGAPVLLMTVIVNTPLFTLPESSVAVTVTAVSPMGKDDPLAWLNTRLGLESQSSSAVAENVTAAEVSPTFAAVTTMLNGSSLPLIFGTGSLASEAVNQPVAAGYTFPAEQEASCR